MTWKAYFGYTANGIERRYALEQGANAFMSQWQAKLASISSPATPMWSTTDMMVAVSLLQTLHYALSKMRLHGLWGHLLTIL